MLNKLLPIPSRLRLVEGPFAPFSCSHCSAAFKVVFLHVWASFCLISCPHHKNPSCSWSCLSKLHFTSWSLSSCKLPSHRVVYAHLPLSPSTFLATPWWFPSLHKLVYILAQGRRIFYTTLRTFWRASFWLLFGDLLGEGSLHSSTSSSRRHHLLVPHS